MCRKIVAIGTLGMFVWTPLVGAERVNPYSEQEGQTIPAQEGQTIPAAVEVEWQRSQKILQQTIRANQPDRPLPDLPEAMAMMGPPQNPAVPPGGINNVPPPVIGVVVGPTTTRGIQDMLQERLPGLTVRLERLRSMLAGLNESQRLEDSRIQQRTFGAISQVNINHTTAMIRWVNRRIAWVNALIAIANANPDEVRGLVRRFNGVAIGQLRGQVASLQGMVRTIEARLNAPRGAGNNMTLAGRNQLLVTLEGARTDLAQAIQTLANAVVTDGFGGIVLSFWDHPEP